LDRAAEGQCEIVAVLVRPDSLSKHNGVALPFVVDLASFLARRPDVVIECAGANALSQVGPSILEHGCDLVAASCGALVDDALRITLVSAAVNSGAKIFVPSGAIGAADALSAMRLAGLDSVRYRGIKPPKSWLGSPAEQLCDLQSIDRRTTFFKGDARQAASTFPNNANVAAVVGFAGIGLDKTRVELIADPTIDKNRHEIEACGKAGHFIFQITGSQSKLNPKTSMLAAYSFTHSALNRVAAVVFG
jgi:aspartate dehydrogenase